MGDDKDALPTIEVHVEEQFEECLDLSWKVAGRWQVDKAEQSRQNQLFTEYAVEMVLDRTPAASSDTKAARSRQPAADAMVKHVNMGKSTRSSIQNMPTNRHFLVSVIGKTRKGEQVRSPWIQAATLDPKERNTDLGILDIMGNPRMNCKQCPCVAYVPMTWSLNSREKMRCRCCGCDYTEHAIVQVQDILKKREEKARKVLKKEKLVPLPNEAVNWDDRECAMFFRSEGQFHPRNDAGEGRPDGLHKEGREGRAGRVSVVTPTTESRHCFHELLWRCFEAQTWPDKELVVVETFQKEHSAFFQNLAKTDPRVVYIKFRREPGADWSIGLKRNIGVHLASGEFIAHFDDDDLYAPVYLSSMVGLLTESKDNAQAVTLSSWFIFDVRKCAWSFCDPIAWGLTQGFDESAQEVRTWSYGYGFSYVFRRKMALDNAYDDINLGEDFAFMSVLQNRRGQRSVVLFHDDFGICLHVQHGGNTSNSIPLREVQRPEALDLDVMELAPIFNSTPLADKTAEPAGGLFEQAVPPSKRTRTVLAHLPSSEAKVECAVSASVDDLLTGLKSQADMDCGDFRVFRVPPPGLATEEKRDAIAAEVLGIAFLAQQDGADANLDPGTSSGKQWRRLLEAAKSPMAGRDRLGLRTRELWLLPPEEAGGDEEEAVDVELEEHWVVRATCQQNSAKDFFSATKDCGVFVPVGATVAQLREVVQEFLPSSAKVMAEKPGRGLVALKDDEPLPREVRFSDFKGKHRFYMRLTGNQALYAMTKMRNFFRRPEQQQRLDELQATASGEHELRGELLKILTEEVYPKILASIGIPYDELSSGQIVKELGRCVMNGDLRVAEVWLEAEILMRNNQNMAVAHGTVNMLRASQGMPPL